MAALTLRQTLETVAVGTDAAAADDLDAPPTVPIVAKLSWAKAFGWGLLGCALGIAGRHAFGLGSEVVVVAAAAPIDERHAALDEAAPRRG